MSRRSPLLDFGLLACACLLALLLAPIAAQAEGKPDIGLAVAGPTNLLYGANATYTLEADNPAGETYGYNLSYRAVLPKGVAYFAGSTTLGSGASASEPVQFHNEATGETTLVWSNVGDLSPGSRETLSFAAKPSLLEYSVGGHFTVQAGAYIAEKARFVPKFNNKGEPVEGSYTGSATGSGERTITALEVTQSEGSPEGEILRGTQDQQTIYGVKVTNNSIKPTSEVEVEEWLPADLEFLGCAGVADHTTNAPTNPGSTEEYPGSGPITIAKPTGGEGCTAPEIVKTETTTPPGASAAGVYTLVRWKPGTLTAGGIKEYRFAAAVPLRENMTKWPGGVEPEPASGKQAANLDNNSGKETTDGEPIVTYAQAKGKFEAVTPVSASDKLERTAKDLRTEKTASTNTLADGEVTLWTIKVESSEYRFNTGIVVTDTLPNGLCPLDEPNLTSSAECAPTGKPEDLPHPAFASATEAANGTWALVWNETSDPELASLKANGTATITFASKTRTHYQKNGKPAEPILAHDTVENSVLAAGTTHVVCAAHATCAEGASGHIDHERPLSEPIQDDSHFSQTAEGPEVNKEVAVAGTECIGDEYTKSKPVYHPGDLICWRLQAIFPELLSTKGSAITDLLPSSVFFEPAFNAGKGEAAVGEDNLPGTTFAHGEATKTEPGGVLSWTLPNSGVVSNGKFIFERVFQTVGTLEQGTQPGELQGNLMKFDSTNSKGESFPERSEADFELQFPQLTLAKQIVAVGGKAITPASTATVKGGEEVTFALTLSNKGKLEAEQTDVRENLATGLTCAEVLSSTNGGVCSEETVEGKAQAHITWGDIGLGGENIKVPPAGEAKLEFTLRLPSALDPGDVLKDKAGVAEYKSPTNDGATFTYIPKENIEPLAHPESEANSEKAIGEAELKTEEAKLKKTHTTSVIEEPTNTAEQATIGEQVTYSVTATVPAGTTLNGVARLTDPGFESAREEYETGSVEALVNGAPAPTGPTGFSTEVVGGKPVVVFPANYGPSPSAATLVTMRFKARVLNVEANYAGGTATQKSIPNSGELSWTSAAGVAEHLTAENPTPLVEPSITLTQTPVTGTKVHGGQLVTYSLKLKNAAGASTAFSNEIVDTIPSGLTPANAKGEALKNGEATASGGIWNEVARTITWKLEKLEGGKEQAYAFFATVNESPVSSTSLENVAVATTGSLKEGAEEKGRTASNTKEPTIKEAAIKKRYESKTEAKLEVEGATIAKETSSATATIGQRVKYTLTVTLPAHVIAYDQTVLDVLPDSLDFDEYVSAECTSGCPPEAAPIVSTYKPVTPTSTTTIGWYLGNLESTVVARTVKLVFYATVRASHRSGGATIETGATISNAASVYYNQKHEVSFEEEKIPSTSKFKKSTASNTVTTKVLEPKLGLVKEVSFDGGKTYSAGPVTLTDGASLSYRLKVSNSGGAAAYGAIVTDKPPSSLEAITPTTNAGYVTKNAEGEIAWKIPGPIAAEGGTVELVYTAKLVPVKQLLPGQAVNNEAKVPTYFGAPEAERLEKPKNYFKGAIEFREYAGPSAKVEATVALPTITIEKAALEGAKYQASANAEVNQPFTWRVIVKNTSTVAAKKLRVSDILPPNWEYAGGASFSKGGSIAPTEAGTLEPGKELTWSTSIELAAGASTTLTYQAKPTLAAETNPGSGKAGVNSASATVLDAAENPEDASGPFSAGPATASGVLVVPVLAVSKTPVKASVAAGANDEYTIVIHNTGLGVAREVLAEDTLPKGMTYKAGSATASPTTGFSEKSASATSIVWEVASIAAGASVEIKVPVGTEASLAEGTKLKNTVAVHATAAPTLVEAEGIITLITSADLEASKSVSPKTVTPGKEVTYTISVLNKGPSVAQAVKLSDPLPVGTKFVSADTGCSNVAGTVECAVGELTPNASAGYHVTVLVESSVTKPVVNTVEATSVTPDPKAENNKATAEVKVTPEADLSLEKTAPKTVITGEEETWTLNVKNKGPSDATGVTVVDPLPAGTSYLKSTSSQGSCAQAAGTVTCKLGSLVSATGATITITAKVTVAPGSLTNTATVSGKEPDPHPENNEASATTTVLEPPSIAKAADSPEATIGHQLKYTLTVTVPAGVATFNQTAIDTLPDTLDFDEFLSATCTAGCTTPETTITPQTYEPKVLGSAPATTSIGWYLGNLTAAPQARTVVLVYRASVREARRAPSKAMVQAPAEIENSATLYYNQTEEGSFEEANIPAPESFDQETAPVSTSATVVEPALSLAKEASVNGAAFSAAPFTIETADSVTYRLQVKNTGTSPAYDADVTDALPSGLTVVGTVANPAATETKAWSEGSPEIAWQIGGPLEPGETVTLEYSVKLAASSVKDGQKLPNTATVSSYFGVSEAEREEGKKNFAGEEILYREYEGPSASLIATVALPVLEVTKTAAQASVVAGEEDSYKILVTNSGTSIANEVQVVDTLPEGMTYEAGKATAKPATGFSEESVAGKVVTWKIASIGVGEDVEIDLPVGIKASVESGEELTNEVAVTSTEQTTPVEAESSIEVTTEADVEAKKSVLGGATTAVPGAQLTYVIAAKNNKGPSVARAVELTDKLPAGVVFVSASAGCTEAVGTVTCAEGNLDPEQEASFQIVVTVLSGYSGSIANAVIAQSTATPGHPATPDPEPENNEAEVEVSTVASADLELVKTALTPEVHPGQPATFSLVVTNKGPSDAEEAELTDTLPAGLTYVSASGASCEAAGQTVTCVLSTFTAGSSVTVTLTTQPASLGSYTNSATVSSTTPDPNPGNNSSEATVKVVPVPSPVPPPASAPASTPPATGVAPSAGAAARTHVTLRKLVREQEVAPGGHLDYRLIVRNAGAQTAEKPQVCDTLPPQTTVINRGGGHLANGRICFTLAALAPGTGHTFTLVLRADSDAGRSIINRAAVTGKNFDPVHAQASTPVRGGGVAPERESRVTG